MKEYTNPEITVTSFTIEDIITISNGNGAVPGVNDGAGTEDI